MYFLSCSIRLLKESGQLDNFWNKWKFKENVCFPAKSEPVVIWSIMGAFGLMVMGVLISACILTFECFAKKAMQSSPNDCKLFEIRNRFNDNRVIEIEVENFAGKILLRNVPINNPEGKESCKETKAILEEILIISKQTLHCVSDIHRLYPTKRIPKNSKEKYDQNPPPIYLKFLTKSEMRKFIKKLNEIRQTPKFKSVQLEYMCPPYLLNYYNASLKDD